MRHVLLLLFTTLLLTAGCTSSRKTADSAAATIPQGRATEQYSQEDIARAKSLYIQGITAFEMQDFNQALDLLTMSYIIVPDDAGVNYSLADAYMFLADFSNAIYYAREALDIDPANKWYHMKLVEIYLRDGQNENAVTSLNTAVSYFPRDIDLLALQAGTLTELGRHAESNAVYDRMLSITGPQVQLHFQKFRNYTIMDKQAAAMSELEKVAELEPDNPTILQTLGGLYVESGNIDKALKLYEAALEAMPGSPEIRIGLADLYIQQGDWDKATDFIIGIVSDSSVARPVKNELVQFLVGRFMQDSSSDPLRRNLSRVVDTLVEAYPGDAEAAALAADFYLLTENDILAIEALENTVRLMPENDAAWRQLMQLYYSASMFDELIGMSDEAEMWAPEDAFIRFFVGVAYSAREQSGQAVAWLTLASEAPARPAFKSVVFGVLGDTHQGMDNWNDAVAAYDRALSFDPDNSTALNNYAYFMSLRRERLEEAYVMSLRSVELEPENPSYLDTLGWIYYKKGDYQNARKYIQASIDNGGSSATILEHMGDVLDKLGDANGARDWWEKAFDRDPERSYLLERLNGDS
jgi:tetratricopeptide (TPR) repeat protein